MRLANRIAVERRMAAAEEIIAQRTMSRAADLLSAEIAALPVRRQHGVMLAVKRASSSGAAPRDAIRVLLTEIARVDAVLAWRIGRSVGITLPSLITRTTES
jgi:hypothetical protein